MVSDGATLVALMGIVPFTKVGIDTTGKEAIPVLMEGVGEIGAEGISPVCAGTTAVDIDMGLSGLVAGGAANDCSSEGSDGIELEDRGADGIIPVGKRVVVLSGEGRRGSPNILN